MIQVKFITIINFAAKVSNYIQSGNGSIKICVKLWDYVLVWIYFRNFAPDYRLVAMMFAETDGACEAGHYIAEKRHTMLCRLADGTSEISYACQRHCRVGCHGYAERVSRCVREG